MPSRVRIPSPAGEKMKRTTVAKKLERMKKPIWKSVAWDLLKNPREVNLNKINRYTKDGDVVIVPGKVLGYGELNHKVTVVAYSFSKSAIEKINKNGKAIDILEFAKEGKTRGVKIIG